MYNPTTILHKFLEVIPRFQFEKIVVEHNADKYSKSFTTWNLFVTLLTAQAKGWDSLREVSTGFKAHASQLYHLGFTTSPNKSTLARVNAKKDSEIFEQFFYQLQAYLRPKLLQKKFDFELNQVLKVIDSTTVELSLSLFDWAKFRFNKGALKIHTSYNLTDQIPEVVNITDGKVGDINGINFNSYHNCIIVFDRGYNCFYWFEVFDRNHVTFVCRAKTNYSFNYLGQHRKPTGKGILRDEVVELKNPDSFEVYPKKFRLVTCIDEETGKEVSFMTNNLEYSAEVISYIYKKRWEIELFFKWIKQNLKIKTFLGTSENAVKTQIWVAMTYYLLLRYVQGQTNFSSMLELTRVVRELLLDNRSVFDIFSAELRSNVKQIDDDVGQLSLKGLLARF
jgi:hypothetical protein